jgi:hypothetical protein
MAEQLILPEPKRRPGRPKGDANRNRVIDVRLRISRQLRDRIDAVCQKSGHSVAREIETCIVEALDGQTTYGGPRLAQLFRQLADIALKIELRENRGSMLDDYTTFVEVRRVWRQVIDDLEPRQTMGAYETPIDGGRIRVDFTPGSPAASLAEALAKSTAAGQTGRSRENAPAASLAEALARNTAADQTGRSREHAPDLGTVRFGETELAALASVVLGALPKKTEAASAPPDGIEGIASAGDKYPRKTNI